jgi:hypothetical protein
MHVLWVVHPWRTPLSPWKSVHSSRIYSLSSFPLTARPKREGREDSEQTQRAEGSVFARQIRLEWTDFHGNNGVRQGWTTPRTCISWPLVGTDPLSPDFDFVELETSQQNGRGLKRNLQVMLYIPTSFLKDKTLATNVPTRTRGITDLKTINIKTPHPTAIAPCSHVWRKP